MMSLALQFGKIVARHIVNDGLTLSARESELHIIEEAAQARQILAELSSYYATSGIAMR